LCEQGMNGQKEVYDFLLCVQKIAVKMRSEERIHTYENRENACMNKS
jgi:hypothetical protein